jgi:hypothetical protein
MKQHLGVAVILLATSLLPAGLRADSALEKDMASFDRAYIPVLALTNQRKLPAARRAMHLLHTRWTEFKTRYHSYKSADREWEEDFAAVGQAIKNAQRLLDQGQDPLKAHEELEAIRATLLGLRRRHNLDYYIDYLTEFHQPMEAIVLTAKDKTPEQLTDTDLEEIHRWLPLALNLWDKVIHAECDPNLFRLNSVKQEDRQKYMARESEALAQLQEALASGNRTAILHSALSLKPHFTKLFMLFGDFDALHPEKGNGVTQKPRQQRRNTDGRL